MSDANIDIIVESSIEIGQKTKNRKHFSKNIVNLVGFFSIFILLFCLVSNAVIVNENYSVANIKGFYEEKRNSLDVVFIGPSEFYADYSATYAWQKFGYTSYAYAVSSLPGNLYKPILEDVLDYQSPNLVVFELNGFLQGDNYYQNCGTMHTCFDNMPFSKHKVSNIDEMVKKDERIQYNLPIIKYHNNWKVPLQCAKGVAVRSIVGMNGSHMKGLVSLTGCDYGNSTSQIQKLSFTDTSKKYLEELLNTCKKKRIQNVLFVRLPHERKIGNPKPLEQAQKVIESYGYDVLNLDDSFDETKIDPKKDFYNPDHMNILGTKKMTEYLGTYMCNKYSINTQHDSGVVRDWENSSKKTDEIIRECEKDLKNGELRRYSEMALYCKPKIEDCLK